MNSNQKTILVCEDEEPLRELVRATLGSGYRLVDAVDGHEALERLASERPDLVVLDIMLPGKSGIEVLEALRGGRSAPLTPVVVLTAWTHAEDEVLAAGADRFLSKPFDPDELKAIVDDLLATA
jgi:CheY-like chemotaxis protein